MTKNKIERPVIAVDAVIFTIIKGSLHLLLVKRKKEPFKEAYALPGAALNIKETLINGVKRSLMENADFTKEEVDSLFLDQLASFDGLYRDPRDRSISIAYMGIMKDPVNENDTITWKNINSIASNELPFDHNLILETAISRLKGKLRYTNIAKSFLNESFRIEELQNIYEAVMQKKLNKTNFRNKLLKINLIKKIKVLNTAVGKKGGRPPHLYKFTDRKINMVEKDFL